MADKQRGVENPVASDMALIGDTCQELASKPLPKRTGPNFGYGQVAPTDQFRVEGKGTNY